MSCVDRFRPCQRVLLSTLHNSKMKKILFIHATLSGQFDWFGHYLVFGLISWVVFQCYLYPGRWQLLVEYFLVILVYWWKMLISHLPRHHLERFHGQFDLYQKIIQKMFCIKVVPPRNCSALKKIRDAIDHSSLSLFSDLAIYKAEILVQFLIFPATLYQTGTLTQRAICRISISISVLKIGLRFSHER